MSDERINVLHEKDIAKALLEAKGNFSSVAKALQCSRQNIQYRVNQSEYLQEIVQEAKESRIDVAEDSLHELVKDKNLGAVCFTLKCLAKDRGYIEQPAEKPAQLNLQVNIERLGEALRNEIEHRAHSIQMIESDPID